MNKDLLIKIFVVNQHLVEIQRDFDKELEVLGHAKEVIDSAQDEIGDLFIELGEE